MTRQTHTENGKTGAKIPRVTRNMTGENIKCPYTFNNNILTSNTLRLKLQRKITEDQHCIID